MVLREKLYTVAEFLAYIDQPEFEGRRLELHEGVIVEMPPSSKKNVRLEGWIITLLNNFVVPKDLGVVTTPDGGFKIDERNYLQPDVGFISHERSGGMEGVEFPVVPDLAIEVISPSESAYSVVSKARTYLVNGSKVVWAFYPEERAVDEFRLADDGGLRVNSFSVDDMLTAEDVLPGFSLSLREVFKVLG
ncbi:MAG: Uma2 family endonuclease [Anaerolineae bacterium]|nr:Uma2 family endonuclease [Anaerolineae bacterium]